MERQAGLKSPIEDFNHYVLGLKQSEDLEISLAAGTFLDKSLEGKILVIESITQDYFVNVQQTDNNQPVIILLPPSFPEKWKEMGEKEEVVLGAIHDALVKLGIYRGSAGELSRRREILLGKIHH